MADPTLTQAKTSDVPNVSQTRAFAFGVAFAGLMAQSVFLLSTRQASHSGSDLAGVLFLAVSLIYGGSVRLWWTFLAPLSLLLLFAPVARWEAMELVDLGRLMRASIVPGLGFIGGALIVTVGRTRASALEESAVVRELTMRQMKSLFDLKSMETEMKDLLKALEDSSQLKSPSDTLAAMTWDLREFGPSQPPPTEAMRENEIDALSYAEFQRVAAEALEKTRAKIPHKPGIRLVLSSVVDAPVPMAVRGKAETLALVIAAILEQAVEGIGGSQGLIRVALRPGLRSVSLVVEDNGRGLNEDLIFKLEAKGLVPKADQRAAEKLNWYEIRTLVHACAWRMERQARLGVGARVVLELPRVDAFAYGSRSMANREALAVDKNPTKDSGSRHA